MPRYAIDDDSSPEWAPIERLARLCGADPSLADLCLDDFMYMGRVRAAGRPSIHLYKHIETRRYLNLDDAGHAYRYVHSERDDGRAEYVPLPDLRVVVHRALLLDRRPPAARGANHRRARGAATSAPPTA